MNLYHSISEQADAVNYLLRHKRYSFPGQDLLSPSKYNLEGWNPNSCSV